MVVRSTLPPVQPPPRGSFTCGQCRSCKHTSVDHHDHIDGLGPVSHTYEDTTFTSSSTGDTHTIHKHLNCQTDNVVYLITCTKKKKQYVGETSRTLEQRLAEHCADARHNRNTPVARHFNQPGHNARNISVICIDKPPKTNSTMRKKLEKDWIAKLQTSNPHGINMKDEPSFIEEILVTSNFAKHSWAYSELHTLLGSRFMGNGLITELRTERWARKRALFNPAFHRSYLKTCLNQFNMSSDLLIKELVGRSDGETEVVMLDEFNRVALDIIGKVAFGTDLGIYSGGSKPFIDAVTCSMKAIADAFSRPWVAFNPLPSVRDYRKEVDKSCQFIRQTGRQCIQSQIDKLHKGKPLSNNIIAYIIQTTSESGEGLPEIEDMVDEFVTFFIAGQETTAKLLAWTIMELTQHPEIVYRLKTEIDAAIGDKDNVAFEDLSKLEYMMAVLKESLRLHPPATGSTRVAPSNCTLDGINIPSGTPVHWFEKKAIATAPLECKPRLRCRYVDDVLEIIKKDITKQLTEHLNTVDTTCNIMFTYEQVQNGKIPFVDTLFVRKEDSTVNTYTMSRMEEYFQNADTYDPDRFLHDDDKSASMYAYFPFSLGPRVCIGQQFALIEARVILSKLLRKFEFKWVPGQSMDLVEDITIKPKDGCKCYISAVL
ncbi:cholesterol 24-hydroxylase-like [Amphiura filiformis]|uniref:cholesterol 24-hydroxylase-like n=1 Tax=Amphiura filiformis TaxID=82378 RepID=UPI003B2160D7